MFAQETNDKRAKEEANKNKIVNEHNKTLEESLQNTISQMETMRGQLL